MGQDSPGSLPVMALHLVSVLCTFICYVLVRHLLVTPLVFRAQNRYRQTFVFQRARLLVYLASSDARCVGFNVNDNRFPRRITVRAAIYVDITVFMRSWDDVVVIGLPVMQLRASSFVEACVVSAPSSVGPSTRSVASRVAVSVGA